MSDIHRFKVDEKEVLVSRNWFLGTIKIWIDGVPLKTKMPVVGGVKKVLRGIANIFDSIKNFELPKVALAVDDGKKLRLKIPELPKLSFFTAAGEAIVDKIKLKLPEIPKPSFVNAAGESIHNLKLKIQKFAVKVLNLKQLSVCTQGVGSALHLNFSPIAPKFIFISFIKLNINFICYF